MKKLLTVLFALNLSIIAFGQTNNNFENTPNTTQDTLKEVWTDGIFDGIYIAKTGYKINDYYIAQEDITSYQVDSLKGKRIIVKGKLKIVKGNDNENIQSISEDRKYITEPKFTYYVYKEPDGFISH